MSNQKTYRPYLTAGEISLIYSLLDDDKPDHRKVKRNLKFYLLKIQEDIISPSYIPIPPQPTLEEKLGLTTDLEKKYLAGEMTPEEELKYTNSLMNTSI